jgi:signal transduction histidine kinase
MLLPAGAEPAALRIVLTVLITFFAAVPLDPLRVLLGEALGRAVLRAPIGARDLVERIEATEVRADQAERLAAIGTIVSAVAHEIRNPLGVIAAHAKILERSGASETSVAAIRGQIDRTKRFLDDLLAYSRPRPLAVREVNLDNAVRAACRDARAAFGEGAADIEQNTPAEIAALADEKGLTDALRILVTNACIAVRGTEDARITINGRIEGEKVRVIVDDNGPGVPKEIRARLFEPFVTGRGRDAEHPGTGLGLAIAARHLDRVGGSLRYEDREGGGARFVIELPKA